MVVIESVYLIRIKSKNGIHKFPLTSKLLLNGKDRLMWNTSVILTE